MLVKRRDDLLTTPRPEFLATPEELQQFLLPLSDAGVDVFHCSTRRFWEPEFAGSDLNLAGWTKKITGKPTITAEGMMISTNMAGRLTFRSYG